MADVLLKCSLALCKGCLALTKIFRHHTQLRQRQGGLVLFGDGLLHKLGEERDGSPLWWRHSWLGARRALWCDPRCAAGGEQLSWSVVCLGWTPRDWKQLLLVGKG